MSQKVPVSNNDKRRFPVRKLTMTAMLGAVATVLMYQAAWSALSIAVCALKQHS